MDNLELINNFFDSQTYMVVATYDGNKPEAALVGFAYADDLTLIFGTHTTTRKFKNLKKNPKVAVVFGNKEKITVQYEGAASVLIEEELNKYKEIYFQKVPSARKYEHLPNQVYIKITPSWLRYTDYNSKPNIIFELKF